MLDFKSIAGCSRIGRLGFRTHAALVGVVLLLAGIGWIADAPFAGSALAQTQSKEAKLRPVQRRLLVARLKERLKTLRRDVERGRQRVRDDLAKWKGEQDAALVQVFDSNKAPRAIRDAADNIYERMIKEYVVFRRDNDPNMWNPWPNLGTRPNPNQKTDTTVKEQREYAECVLKRIDYFFGTKWDYLDLVIKAVDGDGPLPELIDADNPVTTRKTAFRTALTFDGGIRKYLSNTSFSTEIRRPPDEALDPIRRCPVALDLGDTGDTSVGEVALSVDWSAKCLQSDVVRPDSTVKPYHPTTAALMYDNGRAGLTTYCSGTLIAPNAVLTAAHCLCETGAKDPRGQFYRTADACVTGGYSRLGRSVSTLDPGHQKVFLQHAGHFDISHAVVHPRFRWTDQLPTADLAILFLKTPVPGVAPMPLNSLSRLPANTNAVAVGYGAHNPIGVKGKTTDTRTVLEVAGLKLQAKTVTGVCSAFERSRKLICWTYRQSDLKLGSTCRGDSGGPLYAEMGGQTYLVGVTSGGGPSCQPDTAAFDMEVYSYREWIQRQLVMNPPPSQRAGSWLSPAPASGDGMTQFACHFCSLCDQLQATVKTPPKARRVQVSVNCTPDDASRRSEVKLEVSVGKDGKNLCPTTDPAGTAMGCPLAVGPDQELKIKLNAGLLQQCQIVATAFDRQN